MIELGKKYQTKDGRNVEIYKIDGGGCYPVIGIIYLKLAELCECMRWTSDGKCAIDIQDNEDFNGDLVEIPNFKVIKHIQHYKKPHNYFSVVLNIPEEIKWLATDSIGRLCGYTREPTLTYYSFEHKTGEWDGGSNYTKLGEIEFDGDWTQSKLKVNSDK